MSLLAKIGVGVATLLVGVVTTMTLMGGEQWENIRISLNANIDNDGDGDGSCGHPCACGGTCSPANGECPDGTQCDGECKGHFVCMPDCSVCTQKCEEVEWFCRSNIFDNDFPLV